MTDSRDQSARGLGLKTQLEDGFVSPLTAIRGALEILRDFPDLTGLERQQFLKAALDECVRLEFGIEQLAASVYAAAERETGQQTAGPAATDQPGAYADRIRFLPERQVVEVDYSDFVFSSSKLVNDFHDELDAQVERTGKKWYFLVNNRGYSVWPEAWVAFAHRGKKVNHSYSLGTVRYSQTDEPGDEGFESSSGEFSSRDSALRQIEKLRAGGQAPQSG